MRCSLIFIVLVFINLGCSNKESVDVRTSDLINDSFLSKWEKLSTNDIDLQVRQVENSINNPDKDSYIRGLSLTKRYIQENSKEERIGNRAFCGTRAHFYNVLKNNIKLLPSKFYECYIIESILSGERTHIHYFIVFCGEKIIQYKLETPDKLLAKESNFSIDQIDQFFQNKSSVLNCSECNCSPKELFSVTKISFLEKRSKVIFYNCGDEFMVLLEAL